LQYGTMRLPERTGQLPDDDVGESDAAVLRDVHRPLVIEHLLLHLRRFARRVVLVGECTARLTHARHDHVDEQRFELLRGRTDAVQRNPKQR